MKRVFEAVPRLLATTPFRFLLVLLLTLELLYLAEVMLKDRRRVLQNEQRDTVAEAAAQKRASIENALSSTVYLAQGLVAFVRSVAEPSDVQIERALQTIFEADPRIRNIGLAPNNVLQHIYPLEGSRQALGLKYQDLPEQWPAVLQAMTTRRTVVVGPVNLVQGGRAVISRTPVYLEDESYWGVISIVIDLDGLLRDTAPLPQTEKVLFQVLGSATEDGKRDVMLDDGPLIGRAPVQTQIHVGGGDWLVLAAPADGWDRFDQAIWIWRVQLYLGVAALSIFLFAILVSRAEAKRLADELSESNRDLAASNDALEYLSRYDPLTNVANRRYFDEVMARSMAYCRRQSLPLAVLMVDLDHFKSVNDTYGHAVGDDCLIRVASLISQVLQRADDLVARFGGEEFIVLSPGQDITQACALGERIRRAIAGTLIEHDRADLEPLRITASVGVVSVVPDRVLNGEELCRRADEALYRAKRAGRNQVQSDMEQAEETYT